jgi:CMP-N-acetylneuraminic acid synthetase
MTYRLVALMPMRHESERVPGKNYRPFGDGRPLFHHMLEKLAACRQIDKVVVDTDSPTIAEQCESHFPDVVVLERPSHLRSPLTPMNDVLLHDLTMVPSEFYIQTHSTNPLLRTATIERAIDTFFQHHPAYDSLFGVTRVQARLWDGLARAINHNPDILLRTQDLPPVYEENSCIYLYGADTLRERGQRIGTRPYLFEIDPLEAVDIDDEVGFTTAELFYRHHEEIE